MLHDVSQSQPKELMKPIYFLKLTAKATIRVEFSNDKPTAEAFGAILGKDLNAPITSSSVRYDEIVYTVPKLVGEGLYDVEIYCTLTVPSQTRSFLRHAKREKIASTLFSDLRAKWKDLKPGMPKISVLKVDSITERVASFEEQSRALNALTPELNPVLSRMVPWISDISSQEPEARVAIKDIGIDILAEIMAGRPEHTSFTTREP